MSDEETAESSQGCENCPTLAECKCPVGKSPCAAGRCDCDPSVCPCAQEARREHRGCLGVAIPPALPGGGWLVAIVVLLLVVGVGGGLYCTRDRMKESDRPTVVAPKAPSSPSASPTQSKAPAPDVFDPAIHRSDACAPVKAKTAGLELAGSQIECVGVLYGNLDAAKAEQVSTKTGQVVTAGEYFAIFGRANGTPTQVGVGITTEGAATNQGSPDAVDPIGRGGVALAAFGDENGWSLWPLLDASNKFAKTGRSVIGFRDGSDFTVLIAGGDLGPELGKVKVLLETFKRDTPEGRKASDSDPKGASWVLYRALFRPVGEPDRKRELFVLITPTLVIDD